MQKVIKCRNFIVACGFILLAIICAIETDAYAKSYKMEIGFKNENGGLKVWMPIPRYWDGRGVLDLEIIEISPSPTDRYFESNGTEIAYWETSGDTSQDFRIIFEIILSNLDQTGFTPKINPYNTNSELYIKNTAPTVYTQSDNQLIINTAVAIAGNLNNPYEQAKRLHAWVTDFNNISSPLPDDAFITSDALTTLQNGRSDCAGHSNLFVAFCRALGIPARNVSGFLPSSGDSFQDGDFYVFDPNNFFGTHVWTEFYLEGYGWIQGEPSGETRFPFINNERIILSKGNAIKLSHDYSCDYDPYVISGELGHFHLPQVPPEPPAPGGNGIAACQEGGLGNVWLKVEELGGSAGAGGGGGGCVINTLR